MGFPGHGNGIEGIRWNRYVLPLILDYHTTVLGCAGHIPMLFTVLGCAGHILTLYVDLYLLLSSVVKDTYTYYYPRM
ncbi:hypothetical protein HanIR_Chr12g0594621 [Helianthus annuus]|nr:hypothetical protein HanIR_Chr12g0594621 [Helianthus annuus]